MACGSCRRKGNKRKAAKPGHYVVSKHGGLSVKALTQTKRKPKLKL